MDAFYEMFKIVLLFIALLIPGYILGKLKLVEGSAMLSFSNVLMYVAMPALVLSKLIGMDIAGIGVWEIAISAALPIVLVAILLLVCRLFKNGEQAKARALAFCAVFPNCGFLGIPLAAAMWPTNCRVVLYVSVFNVVSTFLLLTVGVYVLSGDKKEINLKKTLISPIFFAIVIGVACSAFGIGAKMTNLNSYSTMLAQLTTPLAMIAAGYELSKLHLIKMWKSAGIYVMSLIKLVAAPLITFGLLCLFKFVCGINISWDLSMAMLVATAVSTAASAPSMAKKYGADAEYAATLTLSGTLLCVITLPLMYLLFDLVF
ncbi:MAG: hypothetical protein E7649_02420 [Ruminococcaceae bacterium]|nr:hypothetical protein [Oscillospiraceae bacterium]